jgi:drug/metabolite transporter (DMT)-like permease
MDEYLVGILAAFLAAALFAITNIAYKQLSDRVSVVDIIITRVWISIPLALVLLLPQFNPGGVVITQNGLIILTISMFLGMILGDALYFMSQNRIGVSRAYPIASSYPLLVYVLAATFLGEPVFFTRVLGAIMVVVGVGMIGAEQRDDDIQSETAQNNYRLLGFILALFTIVAWALSEVSLQVGLSDMDPIDSNFVRVIAGSMMVTPGVFYRKANRMWLNDHKLISKVLLIGFLGFGVTMVLMTFAVSYVGATLNSIILAAAPLISTPISIAFTEEEWNKLVLLGTILSFVGIVLVVLAP